MNTFTPTTPLTQKAVQTWADHMEREARRHAQREDSRVRILQIGAKSEADIVEYHRRECQRALSALTIRSERDQQTMGNAAARLGDWVPAQNQGTTL